MTVTPERTRLEALREREVGLASERDAVMNRLEGYPAAIAAEREQSWYSNQKNRPLAKPNSKLSRLIDADAKDATALAGLNADLSALRSLIEQEDAIVRAQETAEAREQLAGHHVKEEALYEEGGDLLGKLMSVYNKLCDVVEEEDRLATANGLESPVILAVEPVPSTFKASYCCYTRRRQTQPCTRLPMCRS